MTRKAWIALGAATAALIIVAATRKQAGAWDITNPCTGVIAGDHIYDTGIDGTTGNVFGPYVLGCTGEGPTLVWSLSNATHHIHCGGYPVGYRSRPSTAVLPIPTLLSAGDSECVGATYRDVNAFTFTVPPGD